MFGCCNTLFSSPFCRNRCFGDFAPVPPAPSPSFPPVTPPAPPLLRGMQLSLVGSSAGSIAQGDNVCFDAVDVNNTLGVSYAPGSGSVTVARTGTYLVNWWIAVENAQSAEMLAFALSLNGSDQQTVYSDIGGGQIFGSAIVTVSSLPATLSLVNRSSGEVTLATAAKQGGLTLAQLA